MEKHYYTFTEEEDAIMNRIKILYENSYNIFLQLSLDYSYYSKNYYFKNYLTMYYYITIRQFVNLSRYMNYNFLFKDIVFLYEKLYSENNSYKFIKICIVQNTLNKNILYINIPEIYKREEIPSIYYKSETIRSHTIIPLHIGTLNECLYILTKIGVNICIHYGEGSKYTYKDLKNLFRK